VSIFADTSVEDFFGLWELSQGEAGFLGGVVGGAIGVVSAFLIAWYAARKTREQDRKRAADEQLKVEKAKEEEKLERYYKALFLADATLQPLLVQMHNNVRLLSMCVHHIREQALTSSLPRPIVFDNRIMQDFQNLELVNKWLQLSLMIQRINDIVDDFRAYYLRSTEAVHMLQLKMPTGAKLEDHMNANIVRMDYEAIADFGEEAIAVNKRLIADAEGMLALIAHHAKKGMAGKFATVKDMNNYRVPLEQYENELAAVGEQFDSSRMFESPIANA
jgi:hypothetical protein